MPPERAPAATRRPETAEDAAFRLALLRETQGPLFAGLDPALADRILRQQGAAQDAGYRAAHPQARFDILVCDGLPVGRLVTARDAQALTLVDIALLAAWRGRGLGGGLIAALTAGARAAGLPVRLCVAAINPEARRLYERLGFRPVAASDTHVAMAWSPDPAA